MRGLIVLLICFALVGCKDDSNVPVNDPYIIPNAEREAARATLAESAAGAAGKIGFTIVEIPTNKVAASGVTLLKLGDVTAKRGKWSTGEATTQYLVPLDERFAMHIVISDNIARGMSIFPFAKDEPNEYFTWFDWIGGKMRASETSGLLALALNKGKPTKVSFETTTNMKLVPVARTFEIGGERFAVTIHPSSFVSLPPKQLGPADKNPSGQVWDNRLYRAAFAMISVAMFVGTSS